MFTILSTTIPARDHGHPILAMISIFVAHTLSSTLLASSSSGNIEIPVGISLYVAVTVPLAPENTDVPVGISSYNLLSSSSSPFAVLSAFLPNSLNSYSLTPPLRSAIKRIDNLTLPRLFSPITR